MEISTAHKWFCGMLLKVGHPCVEGVHINSSSLATCAAGTPDCTPYMPSSLNSILYVCAIIFPPDFLDRLYQRFSGISGFPGCRRDFLLWWTAKTRFSQGVDISFLPEEAQLWVQAVIEEKRLQCQHGAVGKNKGIWQDRGAYPCNGAPDTGGVKSRRKEKSR